MMYVVIVADDIVKAIVEPIGISYSKLRITPIGVKVAPNTLEIISWRSALEVIITEAMYGM